MHRSRLPILVLVAALVAVAQPADLDAWVSRTMQTFEVPGIAVAIVKDGRTVVSKGYGVRKLGSSGPVDEHTLFGIASNTKAFTATALAMLVGEGKIKWDNPVTTYLPSFATYDPYVSRELTVRDLLCHRSGLGLGAGDLLFWPDTDITRDQVVAATRYIRPASSLRSRYAYNNLMFVIAGEVIHAVTGKPYEDFIRERIFQPLGMTETRITQIGLSEDQNVAAHHSRGWQLEGTLTPIPPTRDQTWAAAAGIKSNLVDLTKWVSAHLNGTNRVWSEQAEWDLQAPQTIVNIPRSVSRLGLNALRPNFSAYGLGFQLRDYKGRKIVSHGGALTGMLTTIYMLPEEKLGIVVLTNQEESGAISSIVWHVIDDYLGQPQQDWIAAYDNARRQTLADAKKHEAKLADARSKTSRPSLPLNSYAGEYRDPWYGKADLQYEAGKVVLRMTHTPRMIADLQHWQYDTFRAIFRDKTVPDAFVTFALGPDGNITEMRMEAVSSLADFSFDYQDLSFSRSTDQATTK